MDEKAVARLACDLIGAARELYKGRSGVLRSLRHRCRDLACLMFSGGALLTLVYAYSKAGEELVRKAYAALKEALKGSRAYPVEGRDEELGYALYAASMYYVMERMEAVREGDPRLDNVVEALCGPQAPVYERYLLVAAAWFKRLSEALLPRE